MDKFGKFKKTVRPKAKTVGWPEGLALPDDVARILRLFMQAYNSYVKAAAQIHKSSDLTSSQVEVLMALAYMQRPMTLTEISPFLPIETASVSLVIDRLQKRKLVQRRHSKSDRRNIFVSLTPLGEETVKSLWPPLFNLVMKTYSNSLTEQERQMFIQILRKIRDANIPES